MNGSRHRSSERPEGAEHNGNQVLGLARAVFDAAEAMETQSRAIDAAGDWHGAYALLVDSQWVREVAGRLARWGARLAREEKINQGPRPEVKTPGEAITQPDKCEEPIE